jgi:DNA repair exonuclease SbcCD ATPase subunit
MNRPVLKLRYASITAAIVVATLLLSLVAPPTAAQAVETEGLGNTTVLRAKAVALQYMLNNSLRLNLSLSEQLREQVASLVNVNVSKLSPDELREFVQNATRVLAEVREGARKAVGKTLESYAHGLAVAIEARVRNMARHYNVSEEEVRQALANMTKSKDMRDVFRALKELQKKFLEGQCKEFANALRERLGNQTAEALKTGEIRGLERSYEALDKAAEALSATLERLKAVNASPVALQAVERALEHVEIVKDVIGKLRGELSRPGPSPIKLPIESIKKSLNETLSELTSRVEEEVNELMIRLNKLQSLAEKVNATDLVKKIQDLKAELLTLLERLKSAESSKDLGQALDDLASIRAKVREVTQSVEDLAKEFREKARERVEGLLTSLESRLSEAKNKLGELKERLEKAKGRAQRGLEEVQRLLNAVSDRLDATLKKLGEIKNRLRTGDVESVTRELPELENNVSELAKSLNNAENLMRA